MRLEPAGQNVEMTISLLLVAEDVAGDCVARRLCAFGFDVRRCERGSAAIRSAVESPPNLMLVDSRTDHSASLQLCRSLRSIDETYAIPLIVLTGRASTDERLQILEAGADDCWSEPVASREFQLRLKAFARRFESNFARHILRYADVELDLDRYRVRRNGVAVELTPMQLKLLRHFLEHPGFVFSREQLLRDVWDNPDLDGGAVTACVVRLRRALNLAGGPNLIQNVPGAGYSLGLDGAGDQPALAGHA